MGVGKERKPRRIQEVLDTFRPRKSYAGIARELGVSRSLVTQVAHGKSNNRNVLRRFLALGVKAADLDLPEDMRAEIENGKRKVA
ncbi:MAG: hypothetical protein DELT_02557 [Desulfovibrio sp.]